MPVLSQQAVFRPKKPKKAVKVMIDSEDEESEGDSARDEEDGSASEAEDAGEAKRALAALNSLGQPEKILSNKRENGLGLFLVKFKGAPLRAAETSAPNASSALLRRCCLVVRRMGCAVTL